ncbi:LacI family DNA-binding transcriptional regulator [Granulicella cerasi]|uniref:LacI family DNA-binding transcriptional regulator n=1 Tax=Granulicella cerasi TaxID=741063 RepID=A0ABW1Z4W8_9BACT|nr:LacI family DNA-binding transcriptional regulator [Granulicella cerasi]
MPGKSKSTNPAPTLVDVARLADVGLGTASRALSGQNLVSEETRKRVERAAERLGYQRNELARGLRVKRSGAVGIVVPNIGGPFMAQCIRGAQKVLRQAHYTSIIAFTDGDGRIENEEIDYLIRHQIDGILIVPSDGEDSVLHTTRVSKLPVVAFDQPISASTFDSVLVKNKQAAKVAVQHLIGHGHKRIGCIGIHRHLYTIQQRIDGYRSAIKDAGLPPMLEIVSPDDGSVARQIDIWRAMKQPPTAIFSINELTTLQVIEAFASRSIKVPEELALVAFDDVQLGPFLHPPLTAMVQPASRIGESAATQLLARINGNADEPAKRLQLDLDFVIRGSCGCTPTA